jgi:hypothetical protein
VLEANRGEATVSAFGYGDDADQDLLRELSELGKGNYAHVQSPEEALTAFAHELGGLPVERRIRREMGLPGRHEPRRVAGAVADAESFDRSKAYRSSLRKGASRSVASTYERGAEADLRAMGRGTATEAQRRMEGSFGGSEPSAPQPSVPPPSRGLRKRSRRW